MSQIRLFEKLAHAESYLKFRPVYPAELMQKIMSFLCAKRPPPHQLAVDVGCGSGQSTIGLAALFERVIGTDVSEAQIEAAAKGNTVANIEYRVGSAESLPIDDTTVDLVTCAEAAHWFDFDAFCQEIDRILKPCGCVAVYGYNVHKLDHKDPDVKGQLDKHFAELYEDTLGPHWTERQKHVENKYADLSIPYLESERDDTLEMRVQWTVRHWIGFIQSWSAYQKYIEKDPTGTGLLDDYKKKILATIATPDASPDDTTVEVVASNFLLLGRKPFEQS